MLNVRLTPAARNDLEEIAEYTLERFGVQQAIIYRDGLIGAMDLLAENPLLGTDQSRILPNTR